MCLRTVADSPAGPAFSGGGLINIYPGKSQLGMHMPPSLLVTLHILKNRFSFLNKVYFIFKSPVFMMGRPGRIS